MPTSDSNTPSPAAQPKAKRQDVFPVLDQLATLYPHLFGARFLPMKRGIFQDLLAAHPDVFNKDALKAALSMHTRSTRYLNCVADGNARHDLQGQTVEPMAPEHVHHALVEVFKRRQNRSAEDLTPVLAERIARAAEASGLDLDDYAQRMQGRDESANAALEQGLGIAKGNAAKSEALVRAFNASGQSVQAFADMYGMDPKVVQRTLDRASVNTTTA